MGWRFSDAASAPPKESCNASDAADARRRSGLHLVVVAASIFASRCDYQPNLLPFFADPVYGRSAPRLIAPHMEDFSNGCSPCPACPDRSHRLVALAINPLT